MTERAMKGPGSREDPINTWDQVGHGGVFISRHYSHGRTPYFSGWQVVRAGYKTDPKAAWYENGCKTFHASSDCDRGKASLERAKEWAGERYGITRWKRNGMGDYVDASKNYPKLRREFVDG